jgi:hypothetical protein
MLWIWLWSLKWMIGQQLSNFIFLSKPSEILTFTGLRPVLAIFLLLLMWVWLALRWVVAKFLLSSWEQGLLLSRRGGPHYDLGSRNCSNFYSALAGPPLIRARNFLLCNSSLKSGLVLTSAPLLWFFGIKSRFVKHRSMNDLISAALQCFPSLTIRILISSLRCHVVCEGWWCWNYLKN